MTLVKKYLWVLFISMVPVIELRGAIPVGVSLGLPLWVNFALCVAGNFLPVPFILLFIRHILRWMKGVKHLDKIALWLEKRAHKHTHKMQKSLMFGLFIFVAIPLPGTGAWTGSLIAAMLDARMKYSLPAIFAGVVVAGLLVSGISYGFLNFLQFLI